MNEIFVKYGMSSRLAKEFGCTIQTVRLALRGAVDSELSHRIRKKALKWGGLEDKRKVVYNIPIRTRNK